MKTSSLTNLFSLVSWPKTRHCPLLRPIPRLLLTAGRAALASTSPDRRATAANPHQRRARSARLSVRLSVPWRSCLGYSHRRPTVVHGSILCEPIQPNPSADPTQPNPLQVEKFGPNPIQPLSFNLLSAELVDRIFSTIALVDLTQPTHRKPNNLNSTQPNPWVNPTHGQLCASHQRCADCGPVRGRTWIRRDFYRPPSNFHPRGGTYRLAALGAITCYLYSLSSSDRGLARRSTRLPSHPLHNVSQCKLIEIVYNCQLY